LRTYTAALKEARLAAFHAEIGLVIEELVVPWVITQGEGSP